MSTIDRQGKEAPESSIDWETIARTALARTTLERLHDIDEAVHPLVTALHHTDDITDDVRELRQQLHRLQILVEEDLTGVCPELEPWEESLRHIPFEKIAEEFHE